jgi:HD-GYP domain-containing protein (c-di-GMP phosphodiesterase class II)
MDSIPLRVRVLFVALLAITTGALGIATSTPEQLSVHDLLVAAALVTMIVAIERQEITISFPSGTIGVAVGGIVAMAAGLHFGPGVGALIVLTAHLIDSILARRAPVKSATNVCIFVFTTICSAWVYQWIADTDLSPLGSFTNMVATVIASLIAVALNMTLIALIVAPVVGISFLDMVKANGQSSMIEAVAMPAIAGLVVILARENAAAVLLMIFPLLAPQLAYRTLDEVRSDIRKTIELLHDTVEERDRETAFHSTRVANYAHTIIEELAHIPHQMTDTIVAAARIHDLGKVGVRDLALHRPGPLTAEERREMERHAALGGEIVKQIQGYELTSAIIRGHHERWDGTGYPDKLAGDQIPLGSRIIAVADSFDAMTSDRVYRRAMSTDAALRELRLNSGTQFDPAVVAAFSRALGAAPARRSVAPVSAPHEARA